MKSTSKYGVPFVLKFSREGIYTGGGYLLNLNHAHTRGGNSTIVTHREWTLTKSQPCSDTGVHLLNLNRDHTQGGHLLNLNHAHTHTQVHV